MLPTKSTSNKNELLCAKTSIISYSTNNSPCISWELTILVWQSLVLVMNSCFCYISVDAELTVMLSHL